MGLLMWVERWHWVTGRLIGGAAHCWVLREQVSHVLLGGCPFGGSCGLAVIITERLVAGCPRWVWSWVRGGLWWRVRPYFENCTVDASIFVAKLLRAHGGCLGIRSR